jgi:hypothetical protein
MFGKLLSIFALLISPISSYVNFDLKYSGNIDLYGNQSLRFSTALNEKYQVFNYDNYPLFSCLNECEKISVCKGVYFIDNGLGCIGLSYLGESPHLTTKISESYIKEFNHDLRTNYSCFNRCDVKGPLHSSKTNDYCWCDIFCSIFKDCCSDYSTFCIDHCIYQNGFCSQLCQNTGYGYNDCSCNQNYFLSSDGVTCHPKFSINGMIYDNYHQHHKHNRNITIEITDGNNTYTQNVDINGMYSFHNLTNTSYTLRQIIKNNCTQIFPTSEIINITLPTDREYDFENFCGMECNCNDNEYISSCDYDIGHGECSICDECGINKIKLQNCTEYQNTVCVHTPTTSQTTTPTTSQTTTPTTSQTTTPTTSQTITPTTSQTTTQTTSQTTTPTTSETSTLTTSETTTILPLKSKSNNDHKLDTGSIVSIVFGSLIIIILISFFIINRNKSNLQQEVVQNRNEGANSYSNPVFHTDENNENNENNENSETTYYQDLPSFEERFVDPDYIDVST